MFLFNLISSQLQLLYKLHLKGGCVVEPVSLACSESRSMDSVLASQPMKIPEFRNTLEETWFRSRKDWIAAST